ncbi:MAG: hypothetical protein ABIE92_14925, partial [bacterium]
FNWNLCEGIYAGTHSPAETPLDDSGIYEVFTNDFSEDPTEAKWYHGTNFTGTAPGRERKIWIGSLLNQASIYTYPNNEDLLIRQVMCHEFYHGIQFSHNYNNMGTNLLPGGPTFESTKWMLESQARFIPTVFMQRYWTAGIPNIEYETYSAFCIDARLFLTDPTYHTKFNLQWLGNIPGVVDYSYVFCLFWRHLYENYAINPQSEAEKLAIIREACHTYDQSLFPVNYSGIEDHMEQILMRGSGSYYAMDDVMRDFVSDVYLNNDIFGRWDPEMGDTFLPEPITQAHILDYGGGSLEHTGAIIYPYGMDYYVYENNSSRRTVSINFNRDPDNDLNMANFYVNCMLEKGGTVFDNEITFELNEDQKRISVELDPNWNLIIAVVRIDADVSRDDDYVIKTGSPSAAWDVWYGREFNDTAHEGRSYFFSNPDEEGFIVSGGSQEYYDGPYDGYAIKTYPNGGRRFEHFYGADDDDNNLGSVDVTSDNCFIHCGLYRSHNSEVEDMWLLKTTRNGVRIWSRLIGGLDSDGGGCVRQTPDGGYIVLGRTKSYGAGDDDFYLVKTDNLGYETWSETYGGLY